MAATEFIAYLPCSLSGYVDDPFDEYMQDTLEEIGSLSGVLELPLDEFGTVRPTIEIIKSTEDIESELEQWDDIPRSDEVTFIKVTASVSLPDRDIEVTDHKGENRTRVQGSQAEQLHRLSARTVFEKRLYDLILVTNIARVGSLEVFRGLLVQDEDKHQTDEMNGAYMLREAWELAEHEIGWPIIRTFGIAKVWDWAKRQEGFMTGFGGSPTSRALNAFTHLFGPVAHPATHLFWTLVGIEALYTKGQGSLQEQVKEKSQTLLGKQDTHKKAIGQMYGFRSRFVHGDLEIAGRHELYDAMDETMRQNTELFQSLRLAEAILVATFQKLISLGWDGVQFTYKAGELPG